LPEEFIASTYIMACGLTNRNFVTVPDTEACLVPSYTAENE